MASSDTEEKAGVSDEEEVKLKSTDNTIVINILLSFIGYYVYGYRYIIEHFDILLNYNIIMDKYFLFQLDDSKVNSEEEQNDSDYSSKKRKRGTYS